jgi:hypothetical protein
LRIYDATHSKIRKKSHPEGADTKKEQFFHTPYVTQMNENSPTYLIIGCGRFGSRAAEKLLEKNPRPRIIVVDRSKKALKKVSHLPIESEVCEGTLCLKKFLLGRQKVDYIIPSVPFHLAFEFILSQSKPWGWKRAKVPPLSGLPNSMTGKTGDLYTSLASFLCPEDCPEPSQFCTITKQRRAKPLHQTLQDLKGPFGSYVIRSQQLARGVGGYRPAALLTLLENIKKRMEPRRTILISTSCRCHGVTSALSF